MLIVSDLGVFCFMFVLFRVLFFKYAFGVLILEFVIEKQNKTKQKLDFAAERNFIIPEPSIFSTSLIQHYKKKRN